MEAASVSQSRVASRPGNRFLSRPFLILAPAAGAILRFWMFRHFCETNGDTAVYGDIARNVLLHGRYALTLGSGQTFSTLIRLPGYPLFLAVCFKLFGVGNYTAVVVLQIAMELAGCLLLADVARQIAPARFSASAAHATLWLAVLCPFTAVYAANPLTECPTLFAISLALFGAYACAFPGAQQSWRVAIALSPSPSAFAALLRPDGALVAVALAPALLFRTPKHIAPVPAKGLVSMALVCATLALTPFAFWTARNWTRLSRFVQPLAPRRLATRSR